MHTGNAFAKIRVFLIGYFILLILLLTFIGVMDWCGYKMLDMTLEFAFFTLLICSALIALTVWIMRRIMRSWVKVVIGSIAGLVILALAMGIMSMMSMMLLYNIPMHYTTLTSPNGKDAVVLRLFSRDMDAANARAAVRKAEESQPDGDDYVLGDLAYEYTAYPRAAKFFYNSRKPSQGTVEIGCSSEGQLMYEWEEDILHMYIENPEEYDRGELTLKLTK